MDSRPGSLSNQQRGIQSFVFQAVSYVLDQLEDNGDGDGKGKRADKNVSELQENLRLLMVPLEEKYSIDAEEMSEAFVWHSLPRILDACEADYARYPIQDPALSNMEEVLYASNGFWATVALSLIHI